MTVTASKLDNLANHHRRWLLAEKPAVAAREMDVIETLAGQVNKMGLQSAGMFLEKAGDAYLAKIDPFCRKLLALARDNGIELSEYGWEDADERRARLAGKTKEQA